MLDFSDLHRERHILFVFGENLGRMFEACREKGATGNSGYTSSVVKMTCNSYRNALEAALKTVDEVEAEALLICHQREADNAVYAWPRVVPSPRPIADLPATVSPAAAE